MPSYYLRYFYAHDAVLAEQLDGVPRAADVARDRARAARALPRSGSSREKPALLEQRGGAFYSEAATGADRLARRGHGDVQVVDVRNAARSPGSPTTTSSRCRRASARAAPCPLPQAPLAPELLGLVQHVAAYERLTAEAAVTRRPRHRTKGAARTPADRPARPDGRARRDAAPRPAGDRG